MTTLWRLAAAEDHQLEALARESGLSVEQAATLRDVLGYLRSLAAYPHAGAWIRLYAARDVLRGTAPRKPAGGDPMDQTAQGAVPSGSPVLPFRGKRDAPAPVALEPLAAFGNTAPSTFSKRSNPTLPFAAVADPPTEALDRPSPPPPSAASPPPPPPVPPSAPPAPPPLATPAFGPEAIVARMRAAGASDRDVQALLGALQPPPPPEDEDE
jgi:hypothetical protein